MANMGVAPGVRPTEAIEIKKEIRDLMRQIEEDLDKSPDLEGVRDALTKIKGAKPE